MFKKSELEEHRSEPVIKPGEPPVATTTGAASKPSSRAPREAATIGPSIVIKGDLSGDEDLIVQGMVEGTISLKQNTVSIGKEGKAVATINARIINIEGTVDGDLHGEEQVVVQRSGQVRGNISAPRVSLEDGCKFKGSIDMDFEDNRSKVRNFKPSAAAAQGGSAPSPQAPATPHQVSRS